MSFGMKTKDHMQGNGNMKKAASKPERRIPRTLSRRAMLKGALGVGVALPWLELMRPRSLRAQSSVTPPKRFGVMFSPCGTIPENWRSTTNSQSDTDFTLSPILEPLAPFQDDLVVLRGMNMDSSQSKYGPIANVHDQGMTHMLTAIGLVKGPAGAGRANHFLDGSAGGPSIDQHIAAAIGGDTLLPSLELGVESTDTFLETLVTHMCYGPVDTNDPYKRAIPIQPVDDPVQIYARLTGSTQAGTTEQILAALQNRKSVLDFVSGDYGDLMGQLGSDDRAKLDQHLTNVRDIETRVSRLMTNPTSASCPGIQAIMPKSPQRQTCLRDQDLRTPDVIATEATNYCVTNFREIGQLQMDLMILALQCDLTRVASLQWSTAESTVIHSWLPLEYQGTREHHMMTHNESVDVSAMAAMVDQATAMTIRRDLTKIHNWYAQQFVYMLTKLKAIDEGNGKSLLDNMLFFWCNELGEGGKHTYYNVPMVLAGSCGGQLPTGRYLDYLGGQTAGFGVGMPHNKLYVTFQKLFGINENTFGLPDFAGTIPGLVPGLD
jgi:hypothetical protein